MILSAVLPDKLIRVALILLLGFGLINNAPAEVQKPRKDSLQFIVIGDWGTPGSQAQKQVAAQMNQLASRTRIDFIVTTGDNFYMKGVQGIDDPLWESTFENIYSLSALKNIPWYVTLGNHDYMGNIHAQIEYGLGHVNWILPQTYYSKEFNLSDQSKVLFLFLDTNPFLEEYRLRPDIYHHIEKQKPGTQISWMKKTLKESSAKWKIALGHHPVYSAGYHGDTESLKNIFPRLFAQQKVQVYFAGHDHHLEHYHLSGATHYFISGGGSRTRSAAMSSDGEFVASSLGFAHVILDSACMQVRFINEEGLQLYQSRIPAHAEKSCP